MRSFSAMFGMLALTALACPIDRPKPAAQVLGEAQAKARVERKNVLVFFDASW